MSAEDQGPEVENALRRIDDLVTALNRIADPAGRETARQLLEAVLDLHGLALARAMTIVAAAESGPELTQRLAADGQVRAVLLLYGLHPEDPATRIRRALDALGPRLAAVGAGIGPVRVSGGIGSIRLIGSGAVEHLHREIEEAAVNAAPDLDEIAVEWLDERDVAAAAG